MKPRRVMRLVLAGAALVAVAAGWWASGDAPASCTVAQRQQLGVGQTIPAPDPQPGHRRSLLRAWRMQLRLDPDLRQPGPAWVLMEGRNQSRSGYELHWRPESLALLVHRGGEDPVLLGAVGLRRPPRSVVFARRGARLTVIVDNATMLVCLDPGGVPDQRSPDIAGWNFQAASDVGATSLAVHDDSGLSTVDGADIPADSPEHLDAEIALGPQSRNERIALGLPASPSPLGPLVSSQRSALGLPAAASPRPDHALLLVRRLLSIQPAREPQAALAALGEAGQAVAALGSSHPDHAALSLWLAYAEARIALSVPDPDGDARWHVAAIGKLATLAAERRAPEGPGLLLSLMPELALRATRPPKVPRPLAEILAERADWLGQLRSVARSVVSAGADIGDYDRQLRFIIHASGALAGSVGTDASPAVLPTPAEAPEWLAARWRALAGADPLTNELKPAPASTFGRDPTLTVIDRLVAAASLAPLTSVRLTATLRESGADIEERRLRAFDAAEPRDRELAKAIVALHLLAESGPTPDEATLRDVRQAQRRLDPDGLLRNDSSRSPQGDRPALVRRDPLAFALACLMEARLTRLVTRLPGGTGMTPKPTQTIPEIIGPDAERFSQLEPFARLLGGRATATEVVWLHADAVLPPAQALAVALAMQEARGEVEPDWSLLRRLPCFTLPLDLLDPSPRPTSKEPVRTAPQLP